MPPSRFITTPDASRSKGATWCEQQEESSLSRHSDQDHSTMKAHSPGQLMRRAQTETRIFLSAHALSEQLRLRGGRGPGSMSKHNTPSLVEVGPPLPSVLGVGGSSRRRFLPTFATPLSREIVEAPNSKKVKMPSVEPFNGTTNPN